MSDAREKALTQWREAKWPLPKIAAICAYEDGWDARDDEVRRLKRLLREVAEDSDGGHWLGGDLYSQIRAALEDGQ